MKTSLLLSFLLLLVVQCKSVECEGNAKSLEALIARADSVLQKDNITATQEVNVVFEAASGLFKEGQYRDSEHYYFAGLQLSPWDMDHQMKYAKVLLSLGNQEKAVSVARLVLQTSEKQKLLEESAEIVGESLSHPIAYFPPVPPKDPVICFIRIGPIEDWIIQESGRQLSEKLGIPVYVHAEQLPLPLPHRSSYKQWAENLKKDIDWSHPYVKQQMKNIGIKNKEKSSPDQTVELLARMLAAQSQDDLRDNFLAYRRLVKERDKQWDASRLLDTLIQNFPKREKIIYVGITAGDIYADDSNFIFGTARRGSNYCLFSYQRYTAWFNDERENHKRLLERIHKQLLSSVGFALGVARPIDPRSARSYPNSLEDHDAKGTWLSLECIEGFENALEHPLPKTTKKESNKALQQIR